MQQASRSLDPFRLLIYLEWLILATVMIIDVILPTPFLRLSRLPWVTVLSTTAFAVTGLERFQRSPALRVISLLIALGLINIATFWGGSRLFVLLSLVLVIRAWLVFSPPQSILATGVILLSFLGTLRGLSQDLTLSPEVTRYWGSSLSLAFVIMFMLSAIFAALLTQAIVSERRSREQLAIANEQLRQYALRIEDQATLQERNRIAREIHDSLGHSLTGLNLQLETAIKLWETKPDVARTFLSEAKQLSSTALKEVRASVAVMRSDPLQSQPLDQALYGLMNNLQRSTGIEPEVKIEIPRPLGSELQVAVYRIVQEALTNICKYSQATAVQVDVVTEAPATSLLVRIRDDGRGFEVAKNTTGFGLQGMRERTLSLNGTFTLLSQPDQGCEVQARFPLPYTLSQA